MTRLAFSPVPVALAAALLLAGSVSGPGSAQTAPAAQPAVKVRAMIQNGPHALTDLIVDGKSVGARPKFGWLLVPTAPGTHHIVAKDDAGRTLEADLTFTIEAAFTHPQYRVWCVLIDDSVRPVKAETCGRVLLMVKPELAPK
jgi:hypothetical protein